MKFHQFSFCWKLANFYTIANRISRKLEIKRTIEIFVEIESFKWKNIRLKIKLIIQSNCKQLDNEKVTIPTNEYSAEISCTIAKAFTLYIFCMWHVYSDILAVLVWNMLIISVFCGPCATASSKINYYSENWMRLFSVWDRIWDMSDYSRCVLFYHKTKNVICSLLVSFVFQWESITNW